MADELQALLDRISEEEIKKAEAQCENILSAAKSEAAEIVAAAKSEAEALKASAQKESEMLLEKGKESLRQASRDLLISLRSELEKRVTRTVENLMSATMSGPALAELIAKVIIGFKKSDGSVDDLKILLSADEFATLENQVKSALAEDIKQHCELAPLPGITGGFKVVFKENGIVYDFTDKSLAESICGSVTPKLAAILSE